MWGLKFGSLMAFAGASVWLNLTGASAADTYYRAVSFAMLLTGAVLAVWTAYDRMVRARKMT